MRYGKALLGDKVRYTVEMQISAVPSQSPCGRQLPLRKGAFGAARDCGLCRALKGVSKRAQDHPLGKLEFTRQGFSS